jgi:trehalose synthase
MIQEPPPVQEVVIAAESVRRFEPILGSEWIRGAEQTADHVRTQLRGRTVWNVNSTAVGGGVAEMLPSLLGYVCGMGIDARWLVIGGEPEFFGVTKRLHHALHGSAGDGRPLGDAEREIYEAVQRHNAPQLLGMVEPGDVVILHDPQTAGLAPYLIEAGAAVAWRCHIGHDATNEEVDRGWSFLAPYLENVPAYVFSRETYVPPQLDKSRAMVIPPSIDPFSPKNEELSEETIRAILMHVGLVDRPTAEGAVSFVGADGTVRAVHRQAQIVREGRAPSWETPLIVQVSRWDPLKDPVGVIDGFRLLVESGRAGEAELVLAGPDVTAVSDDPEGQLVLASVVEAWHALPQQVRGRVHLAQLPTDDLQENAAMVNALQRHSTVIVQKSLHEGFGLTVTEAMWKGRPVVASAVGGIQDQIEGGISGVLLEDAHDMEAYAGALAGLLADGERAATIGQAARERVRERYLGIRHLMQYAELLERAGAW